MASPFTDLLANGHAAFLAVCGGQSSGAACAVVCGAVTRYGVPSQRTSWSDRDEFGQLVQADGSVVLFTSEVAALGLVWDTAFTVAGISARVLRILGDECDPTQEVVYRHAR